jgi:uroporphyrin-III C-methyltransferase
MKPAGRVTLVGAGPGDPELLTLKAVRAIGRATLLLVDDLVSDEVLAYRAPTARVVFVGKRGGCKSTPQEFILRLMVQSARQGHQVVRLKGGDPFIFGRGGEELEHLRQAGIDAVVVNGVTAGLAAANALGVALTHREQAQGVLFVTGHAKPGAAGPNWRSIAAMARDEHLTLVIYMGVSGAATMQAGLLGALSADTPVAIVQNASLPDQRQAVCTLGELVQTIAREGLASPSVIVVGDVVRGVAAASCNQVLAA